MDRSATPATLVRALAEVPERIEAATRRFSQETLMSAPASNQWSPNQILWHIRATADVYGEHIARIIAEDAPRWRHVSPRARMKKVQYDQLPFAESFAAFQRQRRDLVALLSALEPGAWQRSALVRLPERERELTLHERAWGMVNHEEIHCAEIAQP